MSEEHAKRFFVKIEKDEGLRERVTEFLHREGFSCTVDDIAKVAWDLMTAQYVSGLPASEHWGR
ncbi:MAG: Nif11-like leader peptide family natural product precursor [Chlorobium sp.]